MKYGTGDVAVFLKIKNQTKGRPRQDSRGLLTPNRYYSGNLVWEWVWHNSESKSVSVVQVYPRWKPVLTYSQTPGDIIFSSF